jgi:hypothetical protein
MNTQQQIGRLLVDIADICKTGLTTCLVDLRNQGKLVLSNEEIETVSYHLGHVIDTNYNVAIDQVIKLTSDPG